MMMIASFCCVKKKSKYQPQHTHSQKKKKWRRINVSNGVYCSSHSSSSSSSSPPHGPEGHFSFLLGVGGHNTILCKEEEERATTYMDCEMNLGPFVSRRNLIEYYSCRRLVMCWNGVNEGLTDVMVTRSGWEQI